MTTIETITDSQIEALLQNSAQVSDMQQVAICQVALGLDVKCDVTEEELAKVARHLASPEAARRECVRVIAAGQGE
jgi:hypothetical protein